jgi:hypothetical protein
VSAENGNTTAQAPEPGDKNQSGLRRALAAMLALPVFGQILYATGLIALLVLAFGVVAITQFGRARLGGIALALGGFLLCATVIASFCLRRRFFNVLLLVGLLTLHAIASASAEEILPDPGSADIICSREYKLMLTHGYDISYRVKLGQICRDYDDGAISDNTFVGRLNQLIDELNKSLGSRHQGPYHVRSFSQVPAGQATYTTLLLPNRLNGATVATEPLKTIVRDFTDFSNALDAANAGITLINDQGRPDLDLSTHECVDVFRLPGCGQRIFVVTTSVRPGQSLASGQIGVVLDFTNQSDANVECFLSLLASHKNSSIVQISAIVDYMKATISKVPEVVKTWVLKPAGEFGGLEIDTIETIEGAALPCT